MDVLGYFFTEVWNHRRNRFIAVGGVALFLLFLAVALNPVPWVPESLKQTLYVLCVVSFVATVLLMLYYAMKFAVVAAIWLFRRVVGILRRQDPSSLNQRNLPR
jgi:hypothetical protein